MLEPLDDEEPPETGKRGWMRRHPVAVTVIGSLIVAVALVVGLWGKREDFVDAFSSASAALLLWAIALQIIWLIARSEAWHVCVEAAGGTVPRRRLYRAASVVADALVNASTKS